MFTKLELEILKYLCAGCSNEEIAEKLNYSVHNIKKHLTEIYRKYKTKNRIYTAYKIGAEHILEKYNNIYGILKE